MDCMNAMKEMPDKQFDLAIVDPPYNIGVNSKRWFGNEYSDIGVKRMNTMKFKEWDKFAPTTEYIQQLKRVSKEQIIWGDNHFIESIDSNSSCWIVWDKKNDSSTFADCELAYTSFKSAVRIFRFEWNGMLQENMKHKEKRTHPTQKPVALYKWLLKKYAKEGNKILDTHLGSGSIAIACHDMGFDLTGYEIDKDYYDAAVKRFENHQKQGQLFL
jgi:site-specific DNA-methyltransferase (adenine-specific)